MSNMSKTGHKFVEQSGRNAELQKLFKGQEEMIQIEPGSWVQPTNYEEYADRIACYEFEENDVIVMTFPKSGTTWMQEIVWTMKNNPNLDNPMAILPLTVRAPIIGINTVTPRYEMHVVARELFEEELITGDDSDKILGMMKKLPKPSTIKTHLPFELLSPTALNNAKTVYVIRDPRDVCVSHYHHSKVFGYYNFTGTFDEHVETFLAGALWHAPYWGNVIQAWKLRDHPNLHIVFYEKLKKNTNEEYMKLSKFLGTDISETQMDKIIHYTSFDEMKKRDDHILCKDYEADFMVEKGAGFFRQGKSGGWKNELNQEHKDKFQVWINENCPDQEIVDSFLNP